MINLLGEDIYLQYLTDDNLYKGHEDAYEVNWWEILCIFNFVSSTYLLVWLIDRIHISNMLCMWKNIFLLLLGKNLSFKFIFTQGYWSL